MITATATGILPISNALSHETKTTHILPDLQSVSLISMGRLCDDGCIAIFDKKNLNVIKNNSVILKGIQNPEDGSWDIPLAAKTPYMHLMNPSTSNYKKETINAIIIKNQSKQSLANYLHACAGSPALRIFQQAIQRGNFITWPGIDTINFLKYQPNEVLIAKGRLEQERRNLQSTKIFTKDEIEDLCPDQHSKSKISAAQLLPFSGKEMTYGDLTGRFPFQSRCGNEYNMVMYDHDANIILDRLVKNRQAKELAVCWEQLYKELTAHGHDTTMFILDIECSSEMKNAMKKYKLQYQLVPPDMHRRNSIERAIRTFKNHFLSCLATHDGNYPINEWDRLLPQALIILNLLWNSRVDPKLSAYAYLKGNFNFNRTPLAPAGTKATIHKKSSTRDMWDYHSEEGWYIGPALDHYKCFRCLLPKTRSEVVSNTVKLISAKIPIPSQALDDHLKQAVHDNLTILKNPQKTILPLLHYNDLTTHAIQQTAALLQGAREMPVDKPQMKEVVNFPRVPRELINKHINVIPPLRVDRHISTPVYEELHRLQNSRVVKSMPPPKTQSLAIPTPKGRYNPNPFEPPSLPPMLGTSFYLSPHNNVCLPHMPVGAHAPSLFHMFGDLGNKLNIEKLIKGPNAETWLQSLNNELGRLANGIPNKINGTNTIAFIKKNEIPPNKQVTNFKHGE